MALQWGSFANAGIKELVAGADPTLNIKEGTLGDRYELQREIGSGSYGQAVLATRLEDGMQVVCKQIRLFEMDDKARAVSLQGAGVRSGMFVCVKPHTPAACRSFAAYGYQSKLEQRIGQPASGGDARVGKPCRHAGVCRRVTLQDTLTEAKVLAQFNHVNIVHYYECVLEVG